jgi:cytochrome oxidase Cu insertion factor (SCO1/SenC/PrrC family)
MNDPSASGHSPEELQPPLRRVSAGAALPFFLAVAVLFVMAYGGWKWWQVRQFELARGQAIPTSAVGPAVTDFTLTERSGQPFRSADMKGKVWVATYFFTTCPGTCLQVNRNIQALNAMPDLKEVTWVSITCDPDGDNLAELRKYADGFQADPARWLFCRGPLDYTQRVAKGMSVFLERKTHQDRAIVFDKAGNIRGNFDALSRTDCEKMHNLLVELLAEKPPGAVAASAESKTTS